MRFPFILTLSLFPLSALAMPVEDGIFAVFSTNHEAFTCELFYEEAPMTVANFVGLAEGSRAWLDLETGLVERRPFYDGLTFHRVISGFMIQSGSPNGQGTDGPGYRFPDEFHPDLVHDDEGFLSMANSGIDTNGSQFFITVAPTNWLNYKHAIFGRVVDGMDVVKEIAGVSTGANDRPVEPVVIHSVQIVRNGAAAEAFSVEAHGLPVVRDTRARLANEGAGFSVRLLREPQRDYSLSFSNDLQNWSGASVLLSGEPGEEGGFEVTALASGHDRQFYRVAEVDRSPIPAAYFPESLVGKTLDLDVTSHGWNIVLYPDQEPPEGNQVEPLGTGDFNTDTGRDLYYIWFQEKSRGVVFFVLAGYVQFDLHLYFVEEESGTFTGIYRTQSQPYPSVHGTFSLRDRE